VQDDQWMCVVEDMDQWQAVVKRVMSLRVPCHWRLFTCSLTMNLPLYGGNF